MLPDDHQSPVHVSEEALRLRVACNVASEFVFPPLGVVLRPRRMLRARVPKATPYVDGNFRGAECDVEFASQVGHNLLMEPVAQT